MVAFALILLLMPLVVLVIVLVGAWMEARRSEWSFGIGRVLSNTFVGIGGAPLALIAISAVVNALPQQVLQGDVATAGFIRAGLMPPNSGLFIGGWSVWAIVLWPLAQLIMLKLAIDPLNERRADVRAAFGRGLRRAPAAILVSILFSLAFFVGLMVLVVPGIFLMLTWFVVLPVLGVEDGRMLDSFSRSSTLMKGMRWRLLLLLLLTGLLWMVVMGLTSALGVAVAGAGTSGVVVVQMIAATLLGTIPPALLAAVYHEVRTAKEGAGDHNLEAVFA